jgi:hypothetical protein
MKCPYQNFDCPFVDTSDMTKSIICPDCKYYEDGVRPTGATPVLVKPKYEPTDDDIFMMGL